MTLASSSPRSAVAGESGPPARLGPLALLGLSAWCGAVAGLLEVLAILARQRFFGPKQLLNMSRHYVWLVPLTDLLILLLVGAVGGLLMLARPAIGRWAVARVLCAFTLLP